MVRMWFVWVRMPYRVVTVHEGEGCPRGCHLAPDPENTATAAINDVVSRSISMGKSAATQVKQFDEKLGLSATAIATASTVDKKLGISEKFTAGTSAINQQLNSVDEKYQVSEKTKSALVVAEEKVNVAGSAITKSVLTGASWVTGAVSKVAKAADEAVQNAKERATRGDAPDSNVGHPLVSTAQPTAQPAAISLNSVATPRLYEYNPQGSLLRERERGFEGNGVRGQNHASNRSEPLRRRRRKRVLWWVPCFGMGIP